MFTGNKMCFACPSRYSASMLPWFPANTGDINKKSKDDEIFGPFLMVCHLKMVDRHTEVGF